MRSPRRQRTLRHRGLRKLALNSRRPGGARKMRKNFDETSHRHSRHTVRILSMNCATAGTSTTGSNVLQLRDLHSFLTSEPPGICRCTTTGMCTTESRFNELQLWELDCLLTDCTRELAGPAQQRHRAPCQWTATGESQWSAGLDQGTVMSTTFTCTITGISRTSPRTAPGEFPRSAAQFALWERLCRTTGKSTTLSMNWIWGTSS